MLFLFLKKDDTYRTLFLAVMKVLRGVSGYDDLSTLHHCNPIFITTCWIINVAISFLCIDLEVEKEHASKCILG